MSAGNFSNNGKDTFDPVNRFIGVRLQQGVPLLDRDWNELEDIRRYFERMLRQHYLGQGAPDLQGFRITAPTTPAPNDFMVNPGRSIVNGYDVYNLEPIFFSQQGNRTPLTTPAAAETLTIYLQTSVERVDSTDHPALLNQQDINLETCVRDRLDWTVGVARHPANPPAGAYPLARIERPAGQATITNQMITDLRRVNLNLANTVDRTITIEERVDVLENRIDEIQIEIEAIKQQLARLFWDVSLQSSVTDALFGQSVRITARVVDGLGRPINGARLTFSTDWGSLDPSTAVTGANGQVSVDLVGIHAETPPPRSDIGQLQTIVGKVNLATIANPGTIIYNQIKFEPQEMALISKYTPPGLLADLALDLPSAPIIARPVSRTATVTVHAKEGTGAIVRGVGSTQVRFGSWVRDWAKTKVIDVIANVAVGSRIGAIMSTLGGEIETSAQNIATNLLPNVLQDISDDTQLKFKSSVLVNPAVSDSALAQTGTLGQVIAQEATAVVGHNTNQAINSEIQHLVESPTDVKVAQTKIVQASSQITAGFAQNQKQMFSARTF
jgi:hypothetical protein